MIIGQSSLNQLYETLAACEDCPLLTDTVEKVQKIWEMAKDEAPIDNYHRDK
jgi:hypothetical protein